MLRPIIYSYLETGFSWIICKFIDRRTSSDWNTSGLQDWTKGSLVGPAGRPSLTDRIQFGSWRFFKVVLFHPWILKADRPHPRDYPHMPYLLQTNRQNPRTGNDRQTDIRTQATCALSTPRHTNGRTDRTYQLHYLPCFAVHKYCTCQGAIVP